uniref:Uncharacterized protein n=1 Tax=Anopheles farauti TaxID=69004 RepID=A0A182QL40_9DIPT
MADGGARIAPSYCTLPRPPGRVVPAATESTGQPQVSDRAHYYTLRPAAMGAVGGRNQKPNHSPPEDERIESNRSLLYEQNMSTFENFCERRHSEQRLHHPEQHTEDDLPSDDGGQEETLGNFCTLRKVRRTHRGGEGGSLAHLPHTGAYCTLKKKKLQLNRKFVESFLEDPNAKVVDYLSELDAYLDEMDGMDDDGEAAYDSVAGSESDSVGGSEDRPTPSPSGAIADESVSEQAHEDAMVPGERLQYYPTNVRHRLGQPGNDLYQEDRIRFGDIKHFCTLPKQKRTQFLNAFKRGASVRRTFVGEPNAGVGGGGGERSPTAAQIVPETRIECDVGFCS